MSPTRLTLFVLKTLFPEARVLTIASYLNSAFEMINSSLESDIKKKKLAAAFDKITQEMVKNGKSLNRSKARLLASGLYTSEVQTLITADQRSPELVKLYTQYLTSAVDSPVLHVLLLKPPVPISHAAEALMIDALRPIPHEAFIRTALTVEAMGQKQDSKAALIIGRLDEKRARSTTIA